MSDRIQISTTNPTTLQMTVTSQGAPVDTEEVKLEVPVLGFVDTQTTDSNGEVSFVVPAAAGYLDLQILDATVRVASNFPKSLTLECQSEGAVWVGGITVDDDGITYYTGTAGAIPGPEGPPGPAGPGVPVDGTTGQVLAKASDSDYDTEWVNAGSGSGDALKADPLSQFAEVNDYGTPEDGMVLSRKADSGEWQVTRRSGMRVDRRPLMFAHYADQTSAPEGWGNPTQADRRTPNAPSGDPAYSDPNQNGQWYFTERKFLALQDTAQAPVFERYHLGTISGHLTGGSNKGFIPLPVSFALALPDAASTYDDAGLPVTSYPCPFTDDGLPLGGGNTKGNLVESWTTALGLLRTNVEALGGKSIEVSNYVGWNLVYDDAGRTQYNTTLLAVNNDWDDSNSLWTDPPRVSDITGRMAQEYAFQKILGFSSVNYDLGRPVWEQGEGRSLIDAIERDLTVRPMFEAVPRSFESGKQGEQLEDPAPYENGRYMVLFPTISIIDGVTAPSTIASAINVDEWLLDPASTEVHIVFQWAQVANTLGLTGARIRELMDIAHSRGFVVSVDTGTFPPATSDGWTRQEFTSYAQNLYQKSIGLGPVASGSGAVDSVNSQTGIVVLTGSDINSSDSDATTVAQSLVDLEDFDRGSLESGCGTSIAYGGALTATPGGTTFNVASGVGHVLDAYTDPSNPVLTRVEWQDQTGVPIPNIATDPVSIIWLNASGTVVVRNTEPTPDLYRDEILIGKVFHADGVVSSVADQKVVGPNLQAGVHDIYDALGKLNITGNVYAESEAPGADPFEMRRTAGTVFDYGANYSNDVKSPNSVEFPSEDVVQFRTITSTGVLSGLQTVFDPSWREAADGTIENAPADRWTLQYFWLADSGVTVVSVGQESYNSRNAAFNAVGVENHETFPGLDQTAIFRGVFVGNSSSTRFGASSNRFFAANKFGGGVAVGSDVSSLEDLDDVDTSGEAIGDVLEYDGAEWVPATRVKSESEGGGSDAIVNIVSMTQSEYEAPGFTPVATTVYIITGP